MEHNFSKYQLYQQLRGVSLSDALTAFDNLNESELSYQVVQTDTLKLLVSAM